VLARDGGSVDALFERGNMLAALSAVRRSRAATKPSWQKAPAHLGALTNRGNALARLGRRAEALACYERLLTARPATVNALSNAAFALKDLGRYEEALASCERALNIDPNSVRGIDHPRKRPGQACPLRGGFGELRARRGGRSARRRLRLNNRGFALTAAATASATHSASFDSGPRDRPGEYRRARQSGSRLVGDRPLRGRARTFDRALALKPDDAGNPLPIAPMRSPPRTVPERGQRLERVLAIDPGHRMHWARSPFYRLMLCDWSKAEEFEAKLKRALADEEAVVEPFTLLAYSIGPADQAAPYAAVSCTIA